MRTGAESIAGAVQGGVVTLAAIGGALALSSGPFYNAIKSTPIDTSIFMTAVLLVLGCGVGAVMISANNLEDAKNTASGVRTKQLGIGIAK